MRSRLLVTNTPAIASSSADELRRLTPRDITLLALLDSHRVLTTAHLTALLFTSSDRACRRATLLYQRGVLDRFRRWVPTGSAPWHWMLGPIGAAVLAAMHDTATPRPAELRSRRDRLAASPHLGHLVGVNGFFAALTAHSRANNGAELVTWLSERQATAECAEVVRPDGGGVWAQNGRTVAFWLEYDNGTEDLARVVAKLSNGYQHLNGTAVGHPVLFWFPSAVRETHFARMVGRDTLARLNVATASGEHASVNGGPAGAVWAVAGSPLRQRLCDLPTVTGDAP
jgi:hypothetical protein